MDEAIDKYGAMLKVEKDNPADTEACRAVAFKLIEHHDDADKYAALVALLRPRPVVLFSGHQFDVADAKERFGENEAEEVSERIAHHLNELRPQAAFASLSLGADLLFAEQALEQHVELTLVLAYDLKRLRSKSRSEFLNYARNRRPKCGSPV